MRGTLALELVSVTEAAAIAAADWFGKGQKKSADGAAVKAMRAAFDSVAFSGTVVIGEGEKDEAPMLFEGEQVGSGGDAYDIAVDPLECTSHCANGKDNSMAVMAVGPKGSMMTFPGTYLDQICVGTTSAGAIDITRDVAYNVKVIAEAVRKDVGDLTIAMLERDRHAELLAQLRELGVRVRLFEHGSVSACLATFDPDSGIDAFFGTAGAPETVICAAAAQCFGGLIQAKLWCHNEKTRKEAKEMGYTENEIFTHNELARGDDFLFIATGVSDGPSLDGVRYKADHHIVTHSVVLDAKKRLRRYIHTEHHEDYF